MRRRYSFSILATLVLVSIHLLGCGGSGAPKIAISGGFPATGNVGSAYSGTVTASGGSGTLTWSTPTGLPPGVVMETVSGPGELAVGGTPTTAGTYNVSATVTDAKGHSAAYSVTITIGASTNPSISGALPVNGTVGNTYTGTLTVAGGTSPYSWTVTGLPAGVTASGTSTATLTVSGVPTAVATYAVSATVTDANAKTASYTASVSISSPSAVGISYTAFPDGTVGVPYTGPTPTISGGTPPYTVVMTQNTSYIPGLTMDPSTGVLSGTPTKATTVVSIGVKVTDSSTPTPETAVTNFLITVNPAASSVCPARGNESVLTASTPYAFLLQGDDFNDEGIAAAGSFTPNGDGTISAAEVDYNGVDLATGQHLAVNLAGSAYSFGSDGRGCLYLAFTGLVPTEKPAATRTNSAHFTHSAARKPKSRSAKPHPLASGTLSSLTFRFALGGLSGGVYQTGRIIEFNSSATGSVDAGAMHVQDTSSFALSALKSNYAFGIEGWDPDDFRIAIAGTFANSSGTLSAGFADGNDGGPSGPLSGGSGQINSTISSTTGRGSGSYSIPLGGSNGTFTFDFAIYMINSTDFFIVSTDPVADISLLSGRAMQTNASFAAAPLNGYYLLALSGFDSEFGDNFVQVGTLQATSSNTIPFINSFQNDSGNTSEPSFTNLTYAVDAGGVGRISLGGAITTPPVTYLTSGGDTGEAIEGFMVGTDANTSSGFLVLQSASAPALTMADIDGTYAFGSTEDVTGVNAALAGTYTFSGSGTSGTYTNILDISPAAAVSISAQAGSGTLTINPDGSGLFDSGNQAFVTNGTQIYLIDGGDQPLLYIFDAGTLPD
jgi:Putative Ig domain